VRFFNAKIMTQKEIIAKEVTQALHEVFFGMNVEYDGLLKQQGEEYYYWVVKFEPFIFTVSYHPCLNSILVSFHPSDDTPSIPIHHASYSDKRFCKQLFANIKTFYQTLKNLEQ